MENGKGQKGENRGAAREYRRRETRVEGRKERGKKESKETEMERNKKKWECLSQDWKDLCLWMLGMMQQIYIYTTYEKNMIKQAGGVDPDSS